MDVELSLAIIKKLGSHKGLNLPQFRNLWCNDGDGVFTIRGEYSVILPRIKATIRQIDSRLEITAMAFSPSGELIVNFGYIGTKKGE